MNLNLNRQIIDYIAYSIKNKPFVFYKKFTYSWCIKEIRISKM